MDHIDPGWWQESPTLTGTQKQRLNRLRRAVEPSWRPRDGKAQQQLAYAQRASLAAAQGRSEQDGAYIEAARTGQSIAEPRWLAARIEYLEAEQCLWQMRVDVGIDADGAESAFRRISISSYRTELRERQLEIDRKRVVAAWLDRDAARDLPLRLYYRERAETLGDEYLSADVLKILDEDVQHGPPPGSGDAWGRWRTSDEGLTEAEQLCLVTESPMQP